MYVVNLTYHQPIDVVESLQQGHIDWLNQYYQQGVFIVSGRKVPRTGGVILVSSIPRDQLDSILAADPFQQVANYEVTEFAASTSDARLPLLASL